MGGGGLFCGEIIGAKLIFLESARSSVACYHVPLFLRPESFRDPNMTSAKFSSRLFEQFALRKKSPKNVNLREDTDVN